MPLIQNSDLRHSLEPAYARFSTWIYQHALPYWSTTGTDPRGFGFVEHLSLDGAPAAVDYKRVRVQSRQIYVFSHAALLGWTDGLERATAGYRFLVEHGWRAEGGWARRLGCDGGIVDPAADLYDLAFVLFALAWYAKAAQSDEAVAYARKTLVWIQDNMAGPVGGFYNTLPATAEPRQQNPHMHMLEALLALYETTGDATFRTAAEDLFTLFQRHLFEPQTGTLGEFFQENWSPSPGSAGHHIEPGHHYEWVWLLNQFERLTGHSTRVEAEALYRFANEFGIQSGTGLIYDVLDRAGKVTDRSFRLWPQTEAIKAHIVAAENGLARDDVAPVITRIVDNLLGRFLDCEPRGTWIDHYHADLSPRSDKIPSSSFYHIFMAFGEIARKMQAR